MSIVSRLVEMLVVNKKLTASKPYVLSALSGLAVVILLGVFGTFLLAMMVSAVLWLIYSQMLVAGAQISTAALVTAGLTVVTLAITAFAGFRVWSTVRHDVEEIFRQQRPLAAPVIDKVSDVAGSFFTGLRRRG